MTRNTTQFYYYFIHLTPQRSHDNTYNVKIDVRWLSAGEAENRLFELHDDVVELINERANIRNVKKAETVKKIIEKPEFWPIVAYIADVCTILNKTCKNLQYANINEFEVMK